jgi:hypothetical protein
VAIEKGQTREATNAITMTVSQTDTKVVSQSEVAGTAPKAVKAAKTKPPVEEDSGDEPAVRKEAVVGKNVPKGGSDLNKLVDAWDDTDD